MCRNICLISLIERNLIEVLHKWLPNSSVSEEIGVVFSLFAVSVCEVLYKEESFKEICCVIFKAERVYYIRGKNYNHILTFFCVNSGR